MLTTMDALHSAGACSDAKLWSKGEGFDAAPFGVALAACQRGDWLLWWAGKGVRAGWLSRLDLLCLVDAIGAPAKTRQLSERCYRETLAWLGTPSAYAMCREMRGARALERPMDRELATRAQAACVSAIAIEGVGAMAEIMAGVGAFQAMAEDVPARGSLLATMAGRVRAWVHSHPSAGPWWSVLRTQKADPPAEGAGGGPAASA